MTPRDRQLSKIEKEIYESTSKLSNKIKEQNGIV